MLPVRVFLQRVLPPLSLLVLLAGCRALSDGGDVLLGKASVDDVKTEEKAVPRKTPPVVLVADFEMDPANYSPDQGITHRLGVTRALSELREGEPAARAADLVEEMAVGLVRNLREQGVNAERVSAGAGLPAEGWLVQGRFAAVDEGNRLRRAVIGFGQGATRMEIRVAVVDLAEGARVPFLVFGTHEEPAKAPGAAVTMNPYVAAARFVMERNATQRDVDQASRQIAAEIVRFMRSAAH
ncbi:MAG TPA: DUF4410 domain-containing protein [Methylococcus sp.]|nr:DUF4410 domain-containing protein [Methylococcus sp.]